MSDDTWPLVAHNLREAYTALILEGFNEAQAIEVVAQMARGMAQGAIGS